LSDFFYHIFRILLSIGYLGPVLLGMADSSFLFLPLGNDLLIVALAARHHEKLWGYVLGGAFGSTLGVYLLDLVARRIGETGVQHMTGQRRFEYLKRKAEPRAAIFIALACLAPPPFPFTMLVATTSALGYSRKKILLIVAVCRVIRFTILGVLAIHYGRSILQIINTPAFKVTVGAFGALCLIISGFTIAKWVRTSRSRTRAAVS
jgi:membrane protein YqaA with SNARE-associated domain